MLHDSSVTGTVPTEQPDRTAIHCMYCQSEMDVLIQYGTGISMTVQAVCPKCHAAGPIMTVDEDKARALVMEDVRAKRRRRIGNQRLGPRMRKRCIMDAMTRPSVWMNSATK